MTNDKPFVEKKHLVSFVLVTSMFFLWGIPNNLNDILIRQFMKSFELSRFQAGLIQSAFYMGYFIWAIPSALLMKRFNYKTGLISGLLLFSAGCMLFYPAAMVGSYTFFLFALFVIASGLAFLETGANTFVTVLGDPSNSERRLNFSQAFNPIGAILGVIVGTVFILSGIEPGLNEINQMKATGVYNEFLRSETLRVISPYLILAMIGIIMAIALFFCRFPAKKNDTPAIKNESHGKMRDLLKYPHYIKGVIAQFFYVGAQVGTWSYFIQYVQDYTRSPEKTSGMFLTGTLVAFCVGRFTGSFLMKYIKPASLMTLYSLINVFLVAFAVAFPGWAGVWALFFTSFFMSLMYPTIFAMSVKGLGEKTQLGSSFLVMAIIGGAFWPPVMGLVSQAANSMAISLLIPLGAYIYLTYYSLKGSFYKSYEENLVTSYIANTD